MRPFPCVLRGGVGFTDGRVEPIGPDRIGGLDGGLAGGQGVRCMVVGVGGGMRLT